MSWLRKLVDGSLVLALASMSVILCLHVIFRYIFNNPLLGSEELALLCAVWMTFLGSAVAMRDRTHITVDIVVDRLPRRWAGGARAVSGVASLVFALLLMVEGTKLTIFSHAFESSALRFPMSLFFSALPVGAALTAVHIAMGMWREVRTLRGER